MINFFRRIRLRLLGQASSDTVRKSLLASGAPRKYILYALGEIALVVIGILIALQVNTWNIQKINNKTKIEYLKRLQVDLKKDRTNLNFLNQRHNQRTEDVKRFVKYFGKEDISIDTFGTLYWALYHADDFLETNETFFDLVSTGRLDLFEQDDLKYSILDLYSHYKALNSFELHIQKDIRDWLYSHSIGLFDFDVDNLSREEFLQEFRKISKSVQQKNSYNLFLSNAPRLTNLYSEGISKIEKIDELIMEEIK